ncbi:Smg-4/UPF3 family-domain-containing protein [Limtongia smithiae]|uniref:Smg-4/UPF3 family-domain-containing protein n=1 Tax=Limtongia smithiae TaxID=1125753 RepID=UPI0034CF5F12
MSTGKKVLIARPRPAGIIEQQPHAARPSQDSTTSAEAPTADRSARSNDSRSRRRSGPQIAQQQQQQHPRAQSSGSQVKTKFVIRRLPPLYTEEEFQSLTSQFINPEMVEWTYFVPGKIHKSKSTPVTFSRAYAKFKSLDALVAFNKTFAGRTLKDSKGNESAMQIEFAPFDKAPKQRARADPRQGTIDNGKKCELGENIGIGQFVLTCSERP